MVRAGLEDPAAYIRQIIPLGFESIQPFFWQTLHGKDIPRLAGEIRDAIGNSDVVVSSLGMDRTRRRHDRQWLPLGDPGIAPARYPVAAPTTLQPGI